MSSFLPVQIGTWPSGFRMHWRAVLLLVAQTLAITMCAQRRPVILWGPGSSQNTLLGRVLHHPHLICKATLEFQLQQQQDEEEFATI